MRLLSPVKVTGISIGVMVLLLTVLPAKACSIFMLTDRQRTLFANNEDWSDPRTRIWFVSSSQGHYGCAYVGFQNHWAQGGLNSEGLAFDWVAGYKENYQPDSQLRPVKGNPSERMMETCANVEDAIRFYRTYQEPSFSYARILVGDKTGTSVIISAREGRLQFDRKGCSRGFGYGGTMLDRALATNPPPTIASAKGILRTCLQKGTYATKYSNVFDLQTGEMFLFPVPPEGAEVRLSLPKELEKGEHYYDMGRISEQMQQAPKPWPSAANSQSIPDKEPKVTARIRATLQDGIEGKLHAEDFAPEFWDQLAPKRESIQNQLKAFGDLISVTLVDRGEQPGKRAYWYRLEFKNAKVIQRFVLDDRDRLADVEVEDLRQ